MIFFQFPGIPDVQCVFCGAEEGLGDIAFSSERIPGEIQHNRIRLFEKLAPLGLKTWRECHQVHGDTIIKDPEPSDIFCNTTPFPEGDGMMTDLSNCGLMIKTADCQPILLAHSSGEYIMAIHTGWRANRINFPALAVNAFCEEYNLQPGDIWAVRGPSLGPNCAEFMNFDSEWGEPFLPWFNSATKCMDLWDLTRFQLQAAGVHTFHIYGIDICTMTNPGTYFSWRHNKTRGRQASLIWKTRKEH